MKKLFLGLIPASLLMLTSCGILGNLDFDNDYDDDYDDSEREDIEPPTIEDLVKKYSGFEAQYTNPNGDKVAIGGKDNFYWYTVTYEPEGEEPTITTASTTEVKGSEFENISYSSGMKITLSDKTTNFVSTFADAYYIGQLQHGGVLTGLKYTKTTLKGEPAKKYSLAYNTIDLYVSDVDGYTMQVDYSGDNEESSIKFEKVTKGSAVKAPDLSNYVIE